MAQDPLRQWLATMPPDDVIDARITELETELGVWRTLRAKRPNTPADRSGDPVRATSHPASVSAPAVKPIRALSAERLLIAQAMKRCRNATASPATVGAMLRADGHTLSDKNVQVTLMRMLKGNQVNRPRKGSYKLVPEVIELLGADDQAPVSGNGHRPEAVLA